MVPAAETGRSQVTTRLQRKERLAVGALEGGEVTEGVGCFAGGLFMTAQDLRLAEGRRQFKKKKDSIGVSAKRSALHVACTRIVRGSTDLSTSRGTRRPRRRSTIWPSCKVR